jgi:hypothetical protein
VTRDNSNLVVEVGALRLPLGLHPGVPGLKLTGQASKAPVITVLVQITVGPFTNLAGWLRKPKIRSSRSFSKISVLASVLVAWI